MTKWLKMPVIKLKQKKYLLTTLALSLVIIFILIFIMAKIGLNSSRRIRCRSGELLLIDGFDNSSCHTLEGNPCPPNMIFVSIDHNPFVGSCQCDNITHNRTLVLHKDTGLCYFVFTQGYCPTNYWITMKPGQGAICEPNVCRRHTNNMSSTTKQLEGLQWVPLLSPESNGTSTCAILGEPHESCPNDSDVIRFYKRRLYPKCSNDSLWNESNFVEPYRTIYAGVGIPHTDCPEGFIKTELGLCTVEFDYLH